MASPVASPPRRGNSLSVEAREFEPQVPRKESNVKPIKTSHSRRDVFANLDAIPFTPSQGICTPSPTNMAAMWVPHPFFQQQAWGSMNGGFGSPGPSGSSLSESSLMMQSASQPGTPGGAGGNMFGGASMVWSGFCQPLPYSPTALQIAAASGALGSDPSTPVRSRPGSAGPAGAAPAGGSFMAVMPGSPMVVSPGHMMFAQYFGMDNGRDKLSQSPPESKDSSGSGDEGEGSDNGISSSGSGSVEVSEAAHQIASAMCAAQQLPGEPPQQLLELASLLHAYGLVSAVPAFPPAGQPMSSAPLSPDSKRQQQRLRQKSAPKLNPDGSVRLNARQRRTLRRAQERAMKALLEAQSKAHGISSEQAASNLASVGLTSMLLGSPPPAAVAAPMASPMRMPAAGYMAPVMSPGPMPMMAPAAHDFGMMHGMQHTVAAAPIITHGGFDTGYAMAPAGGEMPLPMAMHSVMHTPPRYGSSRLGPGGGYHSGQRHAGSFRSTPGGGGNRMSRFAPADAVAAY